MLIYEYILRNSAIPQNTSSELCKNTERRNGIYTKNPSFDTTTLTSAKI